MKRRAFITLVGGAAMWPVVARAQQAPPVIGYLATGSPEVFVSRLAAWRQGISEHGFVEGRNLVIEYRWASGLYDHMQANAFDLVQRKVDVIFASGPPSLRAASAATPNIPVVFVVGSDPVRDGLVASMSRPDRNLTGITFLAVDLTPKRLELVSELFPQTRLIGLLTNPANAAEDRVVRDVQGAAKTAGFELVLVEARNYDEIDTAFAALAQRKVNVLVVSPDTLFITRAAQIAALASRQTVATIFPYRDSVAAGGLASYGPNIPLVHRDAGRYVGRILKGDKPADLNRLHLNRIISLVVLLKSFGPFP